ncbi:MAG TPA: ferritin-like domain-containing protein, partial [Epsilonproteobacteria bacterium]|nr:ferritin-like domain-containing protein [Campylobacterota bacterium]
MNFYTLLEEAIRCDEIDLKQKYAIECLAYCTQSSTDFGEAFVPAVFEIPSYASICTIVDPRALPSRKDFETPLGLATLIHAVAHIEYSAIDLALDAVYRYPQMSKAYKIDWLEVALDEIRHFQMLEELLEELGYNYGDFPVHSGLFDASRHTAGDILDRMAVIPRYYEASGLDVNPQIIKKLHNKRKIPAVERLIKMLELIYDEE